MMYLKLTANIYIYGTMKKYINYSVLILLYLMLPVAVINAYELKGIYIPLLVLIIISLLLTIYNIFNEK